ncbi:Phthalate dioxygenase reductase [Serratia fonticola]|uniref:Phthalate dioxygenase reductase n=1 Tax=Serratia fonticola TaxID=47917 RepID=A0A3S5B121_SERFO|nr:Phthalate dioxygenase reductase [Serratia fonticola]
MLIAGGVGITPMISMIRTLADRGDRQPLMLIYGSKDWESVTFREELAALEQRVNLKVVHVLTQPQRTGLVSGALSLRNCLNAICHPVMPNMSTLFVVRTS